MGSRKKLETDAEKGSARKRDPLLPKRLAEFGIELNTPCVPWRHGGGYIYMGVSD